MRVVFFPSLKTAEVEPGSTVIKAAESAGVLIDASCNGMGTCGKCKVTIDGQECLACQTTVDRDMEIFIPSTHGGSDRKKKMVKLPDGFDINTKIRRFEVKVPKARMDYQLNDIDRIRAEIGMDDLVVDDNIIRNVHPALEAARGSVTVTTNGNRLIAIEGTNTSSNDVYGIAYDIGTTTVVGMLWDLNTGILIDVDTRTNYQSLYGADVISRIGYSLQEENGLAQLQEKAITCLNEITAGMCERNGIREVDICDATIVGNTTMSHLVWGVTPKSLSRTPFAPVFTEAQDTLACRLGINICPNANVHLLPNIAGHVGSDITAMMLASGISKMKGSHIAIDIGTNGEVVAIKDGHMACCSTAAGPAFEGATITQGMRAADGAIEKVVINNSGVSIQTIGDAPAVGICGSGLIDAVAQLLDAGIVDESGKMLTEDGNFVLAQGDEPVMLTQNDIREVQLAKGAILAGIQTLMKSLDMKLEDIDSVMLAGAFGNYIDIRSALRIGLLPQVCEDKVKAIGNAAGNGSSMALLSSRERANADEIARQVEHIELSCNEDFQDYYITAMTFSL